MFQSLRDKKCRIIIVIHFQVNDDNNQEQEYSNIK